ncbi:MAG: hypothetical protein AAB267_01295 [Candidatus Desantisbacteria bacterium]
MIRQASLQLEYDPRSIEVSRLAGLLISLNPKQKEMLELLLDKEAMAILKESEKDIKEGRTVSIESW